MGFSPSESIWKAGHWLRLPTCAEVFYPNSPCARNATGTADSRVTGSIVRMRPLYFLSDLWGGAAAVSRPDSVGCQVTISGGSNCGTSVIKVSSFSQIQQVHHSDPIAAIRSNSLHVCTGNHNPTTTAVKRSLFSPFTGTSLKSVGVTIKKFNRHAGNWNYSVHYFLFVPDGNAKTFRVLAEVYGPIHIVPNDMGSNCPWAVCTSDQKREQIPIKNPKVRIM